MALFHARPMSTPVRLAVGTATLAAAGAIGAAAFAGTATAADNPPGNNGTVKIDGVPFDDGKGNEPHVICEFRLKFYNFDTPQTATVTFQAWPPTGSKQEILDPETMSVSGNPGTSRTYRFDEFKGATPDPAKGLHIKVTVDTGQGNGKHKVFWLKPCAPPTSESPTTESPTTRPPTTKATQKGALPITGSDPTALGLVASGLLTAGSGLLLFARRLRRRSEP